MAESGTTAAAAATVPSQDDASRGGGDAAGAGAGTGAGAGAGCGDGGAPRPGRLVAVVSGGNKGIGFECCRVLAAAGDHYDVILTARSEERGTAAVAQLAAAGVTNVRWLAPLDLTSEASVARFAEALEKDAGRLDLLLNNAGVAFNPREPETTERARVLLGTNFTGTVRVTEALLPLLRKSPAARVVTVCSQAGKQGRMSDAVRARVTGADATRTSLQQVADDYVAAVTDGTVDDAGFGNNGYGVSKLLLVAYTSLLAREAAAHTGTGSSHALVPMACCPGYCSTDMTAHTGTRSAAEGADTPVWLCLRPLTADEAAAARGGYFYERKPLPWP